MKELIISYYDSGVYWSISSANIIYRREDLSTYRKPIRNQKALQLCKFVDSAFATYDMNALFVLIDKLYKDCSRVIICEDGDTAIYNKLNGKWSLKNERGW